MVRHVSEILAIFKSNSYELSSEILLFINSVISRVIHPNHLASLGALFCHQTADSG